MKQGSGDFVSMLDDIRRQSQKLKEIARRHGVVSLKIFGSVARGEESADSDIDLLVSTGAQVSAWFPAGLIIGLSEFLGRPVDVVTEKGLNAMIRDQVQREAVEI